jgi:hypothetical protein
MTRRIRACLTNRRSPPGRPIPGSPPARGRRVAPQGTVVAVLGRAAPVYSPGGAPSWASRRPDTGLLGCSLWLRQTRRAARRSATRGRRRPGTALDARPRFPGVLPVDGWVSPELSNPPPDAATRVVSDQVGLSPYNWPRELRVYADHRARLEHPWVGGSPTRDVADAVTDAKPHAHSPGRSSSPFARHPLPRLTPGWAHNARRADQIRCPAWPPGALRNVGAAPRLHGAAPGNWAMIPAAGSRVERRIGRCAALRLARCSRQAPHSRDLFERV